MNYMVRLMLLASGSSANNKILGLTQIGEPAFRMKYQLKHDFNYEHVFMYDRKGREVQLCSHNISTKFRDETLKKQPH